MADRADERREEEPAEFEPAAGTEAEHVVEAVVEAVDAEDPRDGHRLEEDDPQQHQVAAAEHVEQLEHVHATLHRRPFHGRVIIIDHCVAIDAYWLTKSFLWLSLLLSSLIHV